MEAIDNTEKIEQVAQMLENPNIEELMPGVHMNKLVQIEGCAIPEFRQWVRFSWAGSTQQGVRFAEKREAWAKLGDCDVPPGMELGIRALGVGEKGILTCGSRFAYADIGRPIRDPVLDVSVLLPDTDVEIEIEVLELGSSLQVGNMSDYERVQEAKLKKMIGNECFLYNDYGRSTKAYSAALKAIDGLLENENISDKEKENDEEEVNINELNEMIYSKLSHQAKFKLILQLMIDCGCNIAAAYLKLKEYAKAESSCIAVLTVDPNNMKGLYRGGIASMYQHKFIEANLAFKLLLELDPENKDGLIKFKELKKREQLYKNKEKQIATKMGANMFKSSENSNSNIKLENELKKEEKEEEVEEDLIADKSNGMDNIDSVDGSLDVSQSKDSIVEGSVEEETTALANSSLTKGYVITLIVLLIAIVASLMNM